MANTTNFGWETPDDTDLVKDGALAMRTLGNAIDTSLVDLKGGTTGQVLSKNTNTDMDFTWVTPNDADAIQNSIVDAKGDLITATADNTPARLASSGVNGQVLTIDTSTSTGLKWAAAAGGGKVLQVVSATTTSAVNITSTSLTDTGITATITPTANTSKILIIISAATAIARATNSVYSGARLFRGATDIGNYGGGIGNAWAVLDFQGPTAVDWRGSLSVSYLDSPNTTSSTTYKLQANLNNTSNNANLAFQQNSAPSTITLLEIGA